MNNYFVSRLGAAEKQAYESLTDAIRSMRRTATVSSFCDTKDIIEYITCCIPDFFYLDHKWSTGFALFVKTVQFKYMYSSFEIDSIRRKLEERAERIISEVINDHQSEYDKAVALHDYLKKNVSYDYDSLKGGGFFSTVSATRVHEAHTMVGALLNGTCVCEGFAKAYQFLCEKVGLDCICVSGSATHTSGGTEGHAWNIVKINGYYHHVDVTWDNQYGGDDSDVPNYSYFGLSDDEIAENHRWNRKLYPECPIAPYNYFKVNNCLIDSRGGLKTYLKECLSFEMNPIMFKLKKGSPVANNTQLVVQCFEEAVKECRFIEASGFRYSVCADTYTLSVEYR